MQETTRRYEQGREEHEIQTAAERITAYERYKRLETILTDPETRAGFTALLRTGVNFGITTADMLPFGLGEAASWTADACKAMGRLFRIDLLDTTPDVSLTTAVATEAIEVFVAGSTPSHAIESLLQLRKDAPRMKQGLQRARAIWSGELQKQQRPEVINAIAAFEE